MFVSNINQRSKQFKQFELQVGNLINELAKYKTLPDYKMLEPDIVSEILYGPRGIRDMVKKYDPNNPDEERAGAFEFVEKSWWLPENK